MSWLEWVPAGHHQDWRHPMIETPEPTEPTPEPEPDGDEDGE